jgi:LysR family transcriptional regulator for bpeEF and oprC
MDMLRAMLAFVRVAEAGSFARAAAQLGLANSSVTALVRNLEQHLCVRLLHRTTRRVALTDEGARYLVRCRQILADIEDAEDNLAGPDSRLRGTLRVEMPAFFGRAVIMPRLRQFCAAHPDLHVVTLLVNRPSGLVEQGLDAAIRIGPLADSSEIARPLGMLRSMTFAAPSYLCRHGRPQSPCELVSHTCLGIWRPALGRAAAWRYERAGEVIEHVPAGPMSTNSIESLVDAAIAGWGVIHVASVGAKAAWSDGRLLRLFEDWETVSLPLALVYPAARHLSRPLRAFGDFAIEAIRSQSDLIESISPTAAAAPPRTSPPRRP